MKTIANAERPRMTDVFLHPTDSISRPARGLNTAPITPESIIYIPMKVPRFLMNQLRMTVVGRSTTRLEASPFKTPEIAHCQGCV